MHALDKTNRVFQWVSTILLVGSALTFLGLAIYYKYFWTSEEMFSALDRLANVWLNLGGFACFGMLCCFLPDIWKD